MESRVENSTLSPTTSENALNFSSTEPGPGAGSDVDDDTGWTVNVPAELEGDTTKGLLIGLGLLVLFVVIVIFVIRKLVEMCRTWNEADKADETAQIEAVATAAALATASRGGGGGRMSREEQLILLEAKKGLAASDSNPGSTQRNMCLNCNLIAMGEVSKTTVSSAYLGYFFPRVKNYDDILSL